MSTICTVILIFIIGSTVATPEEIFRDRKDIKVKTPNYPDKYPSNSTKVWRFRHQYGFWSVHIDQFFLQNSPQCSNDYLEISDISIRKTMKFCGDRQKGTLFTSRGSEMLLKFRSDGSEEHRGFHLEVYHFFSEDDMEKKMNERKSKKSAKVNVTGDNKTPEDSWIFYALLGVVGLALLVLIIMLLLCINGVYKKNRRRYYHRNVVFQTPIVATNSRRYSKSNSREKPVGDNGTRSPTRYV